MIGIFIFGVAVTAIVGLACWLIVTGIREDSAHRKGLATDGLQNDKP